MELYTFGGELAVMPEHGLAHLGFRQVADRQGDPSRSSQVRLVPQRTWHRSRGCVPYIGISETHEGTTDSVRYRTKGKSLLDATWKN